MRHTFKLGTFVLGTVFFAMSVANAADANRRASNEGSTSEVSRSSLGTEVMSIQPQIGILNYTDPALNGYTEMAVGALTEMNTLKFYNPFGLNSDRVFIGPESGLMFSHLAPSGANFFYAPLNLKVAYMFTDRIRAGAHGGGNLALRSTANSMRLSSTPEGSGAALNLFANVGADLDYVITRDIILSARPDFTFTSGDSIFTGTLSLVVPLRVS